MYGIYNVLLILQARRPLWVNFGNGEQLFGLPVTPFPSLQRTSDEIVMLQRLYRCLLCSHLWSVLGSAERQNPSDEVVIRQPLALAPCHESSRKRMSILTRARK